MPFRLRSFVRRGGRGTVAQARAQEVFAPSFGRHIDEGMLDFERVFGRQAPCFLEIGFGSGESLLALAKAHPDKDFIGVETYKPGIGSVFLGMQQADLSNIRIFDADVIDVLIKCIPNGSLSGVQLFFPDPWPKRRHHPRRLIRTDFAETLIAKLKPRGTLHLTTDWENYAQQMMQVLSCQPLLINLAGVHQFSGRSCYRLVLTKFERRALREGRSISELQFVRM